jgi:hypothetical protein
VRNPLIIGLLEWVEMFMYRKAAAVVTVAPATTREIAGRGIDEAKLCTITNGINEDFFRPMERTAWPRETYHWAKKIVVMYIGTHGLSQGLTHDPRYGKDALQRDGHSFRLRGHRRRPRNADRADEGDGARRTWSSCACRKR